MSNPLDEGRIDPDLTGSEQIDPEQIDPEQIDPADNPSNPDLVGNREDAEVWDEEDGEDEYRDEE